MNGKRKTVIGAAAAAAVIGTTVFAAGCTNQLNDLSNVGQAKPDYIITYLNVDNFPNVTMMCVRGAGFATTTRDYDAIIRVPEWDPFCATKVPASGVPAAAPSQSSTP